MIEAMNEHQLRDLLAMFKSQAWLNFREDIAKNRAKSVRKLTYGNFADNENDETERGGIRRDDKILGLEDKAQKTLRKLLDRN